MTVVCCKHLRFTCDEPWILTSECELTNVLLAVEIVKQFRTGELTVYGARKRLAEVKRKGGWGD